MMMIKYDRKKKENKSTIKFAMHFFFQIQNKKNSFLYFINPLQIRGQQIKHIT